MPVPATTRVLPCAMLPLQDVLNALTPLAELVSKLSQLDLSKIDLATLLNGGGNLNLPALAEIVKVRTAADQDTEYSQPIAHQQQVTNTVGLFCKSFHVALAVIIACLTQSCNVLTCLLCSDSRRFVAGTAACCCRPSQICPRTSLPSLK